MCQGCPLFLCLFNITLEALPRIIQQRIKIKWKHGGQEDIQLYLISDDNTKEMPKFPKEKMCKWSMTLPMSQI